MKVSHLALNHTLACGCGLLTTRVTSGVTSESLHDHDGFIPGPAEDSRKQYPLHKVLYVFVTAKSHFLRRQPPHNGLHFGDFGDRDDC